MIPDAADEVAAGQRPVVDGGLSSLFDIENPDYNNQIPRNR